MKIPTVMLAWAQIFYSSSFLSRMYRSNDRQEEKEMRVSNENLGFSGWVTWQMLLLSLTHTRKPRHMPGCEHFHLEPEILHNLWPEKSGRKRCGPGKTGPRHTQAPCRTSDPARNTTKTYGCLSYWAQTNPGIILHSVRGDRPSVYICPKTKTSLPFMARLDKRTKEHSHRRPDRLFRWIFTLGKWQGDRCSETQVEVLM